MLFDAIQGQGMKINLEPAGHWQLPVYPGQVVRTSLTLPRPPGPLFVEHGGSVAVVVVGSR